MDKRKRYIRRGLLLALNTMAAAATSAALASPALAAGQWWIGGAKFAGTETVTATLSSDAVLISTVAGSEVEITCNGIALEAGEILSNNKDRAKKLSLGECTEPKPSGCKVKTPILTVALSSELLVESGKILDEVKPTTGTRLTTITISGCAIEGTYALTGTMRCEIEEPETEAVAKACQFSTPNDFISLGSELATFTADMLVSLSGTNSGKKWSAKAS